MRSLVCALTVIAMGVSSSWAAQAPASLNRGGAPETVPSAIAAIPETAQELVYTPIAPCRAFANQTIAASNIKDFQITGSGSLATQGGPAAGCGIPSSAKAVAISLAAPGTTKRGYLTAFATGTARPSTVSLYVITTGVFVASGTEVAISATGSMSVFASQAATVYGSITGYYAPQIHAVLSYDGGIYTGSGRVLSSVKLATGSYRVEIDRSPTGCTPIASIDGSAYFASSYVSGGYIYANTYAPNGTPIDLYWTLSVHC